MAYQSVLDRRLSKLNERVLAHVTARTRLSAQETLSTQAFAETYRHFKFETPDFHKVWYEALDGPSERLLLLAPREHAKSSLVLTYVVRRIVEDRNVRIGILSQSPDLAHAFLREIKQVLTSAEIIARYGKFKNLAKWNEDEIVVLGAKPSKDVTVFALGAQAGVTGRHCDVLIFDDIESLYTVQTAGRRAKTRAWFSREATPVLSPGGKMIVVGSRKHFDDLYGHLLEPEPDADVQTDDQPEVEGFTYLNNALDAILPDGTPLWPKMWTIERLLARKRQLDRTDIRAWSNEYRNRPIAGEQQMFSPSNWPTYDTIPAGTVVYQGYDLAISERDASDFTACVTIGVTPEKHVYILDVVRGHWSIAQVQQELELQYAMPRAGLDLPVQVGIEAAGFQAPIVRTLLQATHIPGKAIKPTGLGDKVQRARYFEARAANSLIFAPRHRPHWWADFANELEEFPLGAHDDQVDAAVWALSVGLPLSGWQEHFREETQAKAVQVVQQERARLGPSCAACGAPLGANSYSKSTAPNVLYCSELCLKRAA